MKTFDDGKWLYGDSWERFPIETGQVWRAGNNVVSARDLTHLDSLDFLGRTKFDMSYIDPPWNTGNINSFYTKAGFSERKQFNSFIEKLIVLIRKHSPYVNYLEMGKQNLEYVKDLIYRHNGIVTNVWKIKYYRKHDCYLIRYSFTYPDMLDYDFTGMDDELTPKMAIFMEKNVENVLDLCTGRGLTGRTAFAQGKQFFGIELNKRRLANLIDFYSKQGLTINKLRG